MVLKVGVVIERSFVSPVESTLKTRTVVFPDVNPKPQNPKPKAYRALKQQKTLPRRRLGSMPCLRETIASCLVAYYNIL